MVLLTYQCKNERVYIYTRPCGLKIDTFDIIKRKNEMLSKDVV